MHNINQVGGALGEWMAVYFYVYVTRCSDRVWKKSSVS